VERDAIWGQDAVLGHIKPGLPRQQISHTQQTHRIISIGNIQGEQNSFRAFYVLGDMYEQRGNEHEYVALAACEQSSFCFLLI
jgi:hypothetical protein